MYQIIPLTNDIYLCPSISIPHVKFIYFMTSVNIMVNSLSFIFKNLEVHRRALLSLKHVFISFIYFFECFPF